MPTRKSNSSKKTESENGTNGSYVEVDKVGEVDDDEVEQLEEIDLSSDEEDSDDECALIVLKRPPVTERTVEEVEEKDKSLRLAHMKLDMVRKADTVSKELSRAQMQLAKSTLALMSKQRKTKLASPHSVEYRVTKPRQLVQDEVAMAEKREWDRMKEEQRKEIAVMVNHVDRIAASFDRSDVVPDHLFTWMEDDMIALWLFSVEPTMDEPEEYERHLEKRTRLDPIHSPTLPKVKVNWHRLNPNMKRNLPEPVQFPLHGCAQDPEFYTQMEAVYWKNQKQEDRLLFESGKPFGSCYGFWTSQGVLAPPDEAVHGYHCCPESGTWLIAPEGG